MESEFAVFVADKDFLVTHDASFVAAFVADADFSVIYAHAHVRGFADSVILVRGDELEEFVFGIDF